MKNLSLNQKLLASVAAVILVTILQGAFLLWQIWSVSEFAKETTLNSSQLNNLTAEFKQTNKDLQYFLQFSDLEQHDQEKKSIQNKMDKMTNAFTALRNRSSNKEFEKALSDVNKSFEEWKSIANLYLASNKNTLPSFDRLHTVEINIENGLSYFADLNETNDKSLIYHLNQMIYTVSWLSLGVILFSVLAFVLIAYALNRLLKSELGASPDTLVQFIKQMVNGDFNKKIAIHKSDTMSLAFNMNTLQSTLERFVKSLDSMSSQHDAGDVDFRMTADQFKGGYSEMVSRVNTMVDGHVEMNKKIINCVKRFGEGDLNEPLEQFLGKKAFANSAIEQVRANIKLLIADINKLSQFAVEGDLSSRANAELHHGDFRVVIQGVNNTLDALITPLNMAASYVDNFAKGNIPNKITNSYNGDFNTIKNNLNSCIDALNLLVSDTKMLSRAAQENKLDTRADTSKHWGEYRSVVEGINGTLDTVMEKNALEGIEKTNIAQTLAKAVEQTQNVIEGAKTGDLTSRVPLEGKTGAIASLCEGVNALMDKMTEVIVQVREAGETINTAAGEISSGNNDLSSRTEQQASSLEETAASMEELASTVKHNAENAKQANELAASASNVAVKGGEVVGQVVSTMSAINESAKKIEDIISVIDGIAFQTNILALNAAVEAARAGEQGRGFAVVAGEVRNLAQRSSSAAKEIKELINDSVSKTAEGTAQVEQAGKTMQEIVSSVQLVTDIISKIAEASEEQSSGINQVNQAVTSMDEVTQQNAALVEEAAAAAESLVEQATGLVDVVSEFKLINSNIKQNDRRHLRSAMRGSIVTGIRQNSKSGTYGSF